jgi:hypothetical protein
MMNRSWYSLSARARYKVIADQEDFVQLQIAQLERMKLSAARQAARERKEDPWETRGKKLKAHLLRKARAARKRVAQ